MATARGQTHFRSFRAAAGLFGVPTAQPQISAYVVKATSPLGIQFPSSATLTGKGSDSLQSLRLFLHSSWLKLAIWVGRYLSEVCEETTVGCLVVRAAAELLAKCSVDFGWPNENCWWDKLNTGGIGWDALWHNQDELPETIMVFSFEKARLEFFQECIISSSCCHVSWQSHLTFGRLAWMSIPLE